jgi:predicted nucleic acid-binding protein
VIVLDSNIVSDYLVGRSAAESFLREHESERCAVSTIVVYEVMMGAVHGHLGGEPDSIRDGLTMSFDILPVDDEVAQAAVELQSELLDVGALAEAQDALIAATARYHGGQFATNEQTFWKPAVQSVLDVVEYDRD